MLAEMRTRRSRSRQAFVDRCVDALNAGELTRRGGRRWPSGGAPSCRGASIDRCLQLHGGYGYMLEYPIARAYADARVTRIYGGTNEIMKEIIGRSLLREDA